MGWYGGVSAAALRSDVIGAGLPGAPPLKLNDRPFAGPAPMIPASVANFASRVHDDHRADR